MEITKAIESDEVINDPDIDVIFICTPNYLNKPFTISSLSAGKHVFCEKPPAFTADDVKEICEVEKEVLEQVLGTEVEFVNRCRDGHHCCEFQIQT